MKKLLLSSIVLLTFSTSIAVFEVSCKKESFADTRNSNISVSQQNKIIYTKNILLKGSQGAYYAEIWSANYDGSNANKINIDLPTGLFIEYSTFVKISPDQKTIFFRVGDVNEDNNGTGFYSANIDGSNPKLVIPNDGSISSIEVAY